MGPFVSRRQQRIELRRIYLDQHGRLDGLVAILWMRPGLASHDAEPLIGPSLLSAYGHVGLDALPEVGILLPEPG